VVDDGRDEDGIEPEEKRAANIDRDTGGDTDFEAGKTEGRPISEEHVQISTLDDVCSVQHKKNDRWKRAGEAT
jgi:hypothetical protein